MGFFAKLFGSRKADPSIVSVEVSTTWHYTGEADCPSSHEISPVEIPDIVCADAVGYFNLAVYSVCGHVENPATKRNNKKRITVNAVDVVDAEKVATNLGILGPLVIEPIKTHDTPPNEYQLASAKEYGIIIPQNAVDADVRAMVSRGKDISPTPDFARFCTDKRLLFSRFIGECDLLRTVHSVLSPRDLLAIFACAVDCTAAGKRLGNPCADPRYYAFADSAPQEIIRQIDERWISDLPSPRKGTNAWKAVVSYLNC